MFKIVKELLIDCYNPTEEISSQCSLRCKKKCKFFADAIEDEEESQILTPENINTLKEILINKNKSVAVLHINSSNSRIRTAANKVLFNSKCIQEQMLDIEKDIMEHGNPKPIEDLLLTLSFFEIRRICICDMEYRYKKQLEIASKDYTMYYKIPCPHKHNVKCYWQDTADPSSCLISSSKACSEKAKEIFKEILIEQNKATALFCLEHYQDNVHMAAKYLLGLPYCNGIVVGNFNGHPSCDISRSELFS